MVVVGLDAALAEREAQRLAPPGQARQLAIQRAADRNLDPAGAAELIVAAFERRS